MQKYYKIRVGKLYVRYIDTNCYCGRTSFIEELKLCCFKEDGDTFNEEDVEGAATLLERNLCTEVIVEEE